MKKIFQLSALLAALALTVAGCSKNELDTDQFDSDAVILQAYGPQPVVRGGVLRFIGSNLDKVVSVTIPENNVITDIEVVSSGKHAEIRVTVPKETSAPGYPVLTLADGTTLTGRTQLTYSEPITIDGFTPAEALPGAVVTFQGDYLNLIHEVIFADKVKVSESAFTAHDRYTIQVAVPETARTGKVGLGTVDETALGELDEKEAAALLATLNIVETEEELTVTTARGTLAGTRVKAGSTVTINGTDLGLVKTLVLEGATVTEFTATASQLTFTLPAAATDGEVLMVMASGVEVSAGTLTTVVPSGLSVTPAPVKNGAVLTLSGADLDLVTGVELPNAGYVGFEGSDALTLTVPETAQAGDILLHLENGKSVAVAYALVVPVLAGYSADPAAAGSEVTLTGTDLDLVASVTFAGADPVEVEAAEQEITVAVPTAAETGPVVLNLRNGTSVEGPELAIDKPAGAYIAQMPGTLYTPGEMFIIDIENAGHLTGVQFDGVDVTYILSGSTLYVQIPSNASASTTLTLLSDNGSVTYAMNIDPGDFIVNTIWTGRASIGNWGGMTDLSWGGYDWSTVTAGQTLFVHLTPDVEEGQWYCISLRSGTSWGALAGVPGQYDNPESPFGIALSQETIDDLLANNGLVITGYMCTITGISIK